LFEDKTQKLLLENMKKAFTGSVSTGEGSFVESVFSPAAIELAQTYVGMEQILKEAFPQTASFESLKLKAEEYGIEVKENETHEDLLDRVLLKMRSPSTSGNKNDYINWAMSVDGVGAAKVFPATKDMPGTVKVYIVGNDRRLVQAVKVQEVSDFIETVRPVGANVEVYSGLETPIHVTAEVKLDHVENLSNVTTAFELALTEYFKDIAFVESQVSASQVVRKLLDLEHVVECIMSTFELNGATQNPVIPDENVPVVGTITLNIISGESGA